jgi:hypothetical protein
MGGNFKGNSPAGACQSLKLILLCILVNDWHSAGAHPLGSLPCVSEVCVDPSKFLSHYLVIPSQFIGVKGGNVT